jgi:hypothetical protein
MTRLDSFLLVKEMKARFFDFHVDELDILAALTPPGRHEHQDYDRLEFFGEFASFTCSKDQLTCM